MRRDLELIKSLRKHFDTPSLLVILITFVLFVAALFTKEVLHDILLEAGVFLVSLKLIIASYKQSVTSRTIEEKLDEISRKLDRD